MIVGTILLNMSGGIWSTLTEVLDEAIWERLDNIKSVAVVLAAMLAAFTVLRNSSDYIQGDSRFIWPVMRPVIILICVMEFPVICNLVEGLVNIFTRDIAEAASSDFSDLGKVMENAFADIHADALSKADEAEALSGEEKWGFLKKIKEGLSIAASSYFKTKQVSMMSLMAFIGRLIAELIFFVYEILAAVYLAVTKLFGPVVFAVSILEDQKGGISAWLSRYIQIALWIPVGYVLIFLLTACYEGICRLIIESGMMSGAFLLGLSMIIAVVAAIMAIPKIASWVVQSSGSANAQSGMERTLGNMLRKLIK